MNIMTKVSGKYSVRWSGFFINKVAEIELLLSEDPSLLGMADYIQIVGRKG